MLSRLGNMRAMCRALEVGIIILSRFLTERMEGSRRYG